MSKTSPEDLAVAFRSFDRRRREALGDHNASAAADLIALLDQHVAAAAGILGTAPDGAAVAAELDRRPSDRWDDPTLDEVRRLALEAGSVLRQIEARVRAASEDA